MPCLTAARLGLQCIGLPCLRLRGLGLPYLRLLRTCLEVLCLTMPRLRQLHCLRANELLAPGSSAG